jgi:predicted dehydrogenase
MNRRAFLKSSSALATGAVLSSSSVFARSMKPVMPSDTLNVALIGCRSMGWGDLQDLLRHKEVKCLALCDIDTTILHNRGSEIEKVRGYKPDLYADYRSILDRKDIDIVVIGTPDHWHCLQFTDACSAGKDVYVEKPAANSIAECDSMVAYAHKYNRVIQVGQQQRSSRHFWDMIDYLRSGKLGKIGRVHVWANFNYAALPPLGADSPVPDGVDFNKWLGPAPERSFNNGRFHGSWRMFWNYGGGLITDWGVHLLDMALWGMDVKTMPNSVFGAGGKYFYPAGGHETFDTMSVVYQFDDFLIEWENNAGTETGPYGKCYGFLFKGSHGTLVADRDNWSVYPEKDKTPELTVKADYRDRQTHIANFIECVKARTPEKAACTIDTGSLAAKYAHLGNIAARTGEKLRYNDIKKTFNNSEANKYIKPEYRSPYKFPSRK